MAIVASADGVGFDLDGELREAVVALDFAEAGSASSIPAAVQRMHISPLLQFSTLRWITRTVEIIDSHGLV